MKEEDNIIVKWAQEDVETSYSVLNNNNNNNIYIGESNDKLPPRTCPGCSLPEQHRSQDWALVPASPASKAEC